MVDPSACKKYIFWREDFETKSHQRHQLCSWHLFLQQCGPHSHTRLKCTCFVNDKIGRKYKKTILKTLLAPFPLWHVFFSQVEKDYSVGSKLAQLLPEALHHLQVNCVTFTSGEVVSEDTMKWGDVKGQVARGQAQRVYQPEHTVKIALRKGFWANNKILHSFINLGDSQLNLLFPKNYGTLLIYGAKLFLNV